jgi:DNA-binding NarL/FixJ family response regulator
MRPVRVVIGEDHPIFRSALETLLADHRDLEVVGTVGTGKELVEMVQDASPDVAVVDLRMPGGDGIWATSEISSTSTKVLVLTSAEDERAITEALGAGASGYVLKSAEPDAIVEAVIAVAAGIVPLSHSVLTSIGRRRVSRGDQFPELTAREFDVLEALARGHNNAAIARRLGLSDKTVRNHVSNILAKLAVPDRTAAVVTARDRGLGVTPDSGESNEPYDA